MSELKCDVNAVKLMYKDLMRKYYQNLRLAENGLHSAMDGMMYGSYGKNENPHYNLDKIIELLHSTYVITEHIHGSLMSLAEFDDYLNKEGKNRKDDSSDDDELI